MRMLKNPPSRRDASRPIVSITPLSLDRDSRTLKQARAAAHFGCPSVVTQACPAQRGVDGLTLRAAAPCREGGGLLGILRRYLWQLGIATYRATPAGARLYHLHAPYQFPAVYLRARKARAPLVYDVHDDYTRMESHSGGVLHRRLLGPALARLERLCIRKAAAVVTVCETIAASYARRFGTEVLVVRNSHDSRTDVSPSLALREVCGVTDADPLAVVIGQAKAGRATGALLRAFATLPDNAHLAFVGRGYEDLRGAIADLGLTGRVHLVPPVAPWEVVPFIAGADVSLILYTPINDNYRASLPNSLFQSFAAGLPLLYPDLPEIRRLAERYDAGLCIDPHDEAALATALQTVFTDTERAQHFAHGAARAHEDIGWHKEERLLLDLYTRLLAEDACS